MPEIQFLNTLDYVVVGLYMLMVVGIGMYVSRFNKKTTDYFKGGGHIPWGLSAISLFVSGFSAFMFVGAAGVTYGSGGGAMVLFSLACPAYLLGYFIYGPLWRRTRIDTPMQFLNRRYSPSTTYFYTLLAVVPNVLVLGIWIYMLCIFIATALGLGDLTVAVAGVALNGFQLTLLVTGIVMVLYTMVGGLWAVMVTDAVQFVILFLISLLVLPLAFLFLGDGSLSGGLNRLVRDAPEGYFRVTLDGQPALFWIAYFINIVLGYNVNWHIAQRYYSVPDERDTRKMALWCAVLGFGLPMLWILPVLTTPILFPDLDAMWTSLAKPSEAAFVTLALAVLPHGMLGIMVAAIFAATMSSADTTFNWLAAVLTKDVYVPAAERLRGRAPSDRTQLWVGKASVAVMGVIAIWVALSMERFGGAFDVYLRAESLYKPAMFVPVLLGLVYTRTPWWSGVAALGAGVLGIIAVGLVAGAGEGTGLDPMAAIFANMDLVVFGLELSRYEINTLVGVGLSSAVFLASALVPGRTGAFKPRIEALERDLKTPAHAPPDAPLDLRGLSAYRLAGRLAVAIGAVLLAMALLTWGEGGHLNLIAGLLAIGLGVAVVVTTRRYERRHAASTLEPSIS